MPHQSIHRMKAAAAALACCAALSAAERGALAHVAVASGPGFSNTTQEVVFGVGHGCSGADTYSVTIDIPAGVTSVRPLRSDFGKATVTKNMGGTITAVTWEKPLADALDADTNYYKLIIRMKLPDKPFTMLYFAAHQTCRDAMGKMTTVDWVALPGAPVPDGGEAPEPAAPLVVVPPRIPGWNKYKAPAQITDLSGFLKDAVIVWKGTAAWSSNPNTAMQIKSPQGVTELTGLQANDEFWVKY